MVVLSEITRFYERRDWAAFFKQTARKKFVLVGKESDQPAMMPRQGLETLNVRAALPSGVAKSEEAALKLRVRE